MSDINRIKVYKYKNIAAAMAVMLLALVALSTSCKVGDTDKKANNVGNSTADSSAADDTAVDTANGKRLTKNYVYKEVQSVGEGLLVQVDSDHPYIGKIGETDTLYRYLFTADGEQIMAAGLPSDEAMTEMLIALNSLAVDFRNATGLDTLMVTSLIPDDTAVKKDEAYIGSCADLMVNEDGEYKPFTGIKDYAWVTNNCYRYGFVMRGASRLRYIGKEAAACIKDMSRSEGAAGLEKLETAIKDYTFEEPLYFTSDDGAEYAGYFVPSGDGATTSVPVPAKADDSEYGNFISGNNDDGYIVFVSLSEDTSVKKNGDGSNDSSAAAGG